VFRPMSGLMAQRFTSGGTAAEQEAAGKEAAAGRPLDPAEEAARMGMFGPMTRSVGNFAPTRLVCKRFGVKPPDAVVVDEPENQAGRSGGAAAIPQSLVEQMIRESAATRMVAVPQGTSDGTASIAEPSRELKVVDSERNEALEKERPGDAVFKAIFGSDDDSDD
jgi:G patch domain-containing protein 1